MVKLALFTQILIVILKLYRIISEENKHLFLVTNFSVLDSIHVKSSYKWKSCDCFLWNVGHLMAVKLFLNKILYLNLFIC